MNSTEPGPGFLVWRQDDNGVRAIVGACHRKDDALRVVQTLEARGHKQHYWVEESGEEAARLVPFVFGAPSLGVLGRITAPPVRLDLAPSWTAATRRTDPAGTLRFEWPPRRHEGGVELVVAGWKLDAPVSFDAFVEDYWSNARLGYRKYVPEEVVRSQLGGRPACGYDSGTGVSEIFAWLIQASQMILVWAACEVYITLEGGSPRDAVDVSREILSGLVFLDQPD
jgi:hypothetical protein